jgi:hypothetical protein
MSLIDEALKRAQAAQIPAPQAPSVWTQTPTHLPDRRSAWKRPAIWLISVLLLAALAAFVSIRQGGTKPASRSSAALERRPAPTAAASTAESQAQASGRLVPSPLASALEPEMPAHADVQSVRPPTIAPTHPVVAAPAEAPPAGRTTNDRPSRALVDGKSYSGEILLASGAKIELGGIVYSEESPVALINGRVVARGDSVEGLTVAKIEPERVELEGHGVRVFLVLK